MAATGAAKLGRLIAEQLALHATPHGRGSQGQNACTVAVNVMFTSGARESFGGPNVFGVQDDPKHYDV